MVIDGDVRLCWDKYPRLLRRDSPSVSEFGDVRRPHHSLGRNAIGFFAKDANEVRTVSRNNENLELVLPQIIEQFQHRLINKIGIDTTEARILCSSEPLGNDARKLLRAHA